MLRKMHNKFLAVMPLCLLLVAGAVKAEPADKVLWLDVRTAEEFSADHLTGAINIPHQQVADQVTLLGLDKNQPIVVYCRTGRRSGIAENTLLALGFEQVINAETLADARALSSAWQGQAEGL